MTTRFESRSRTLYFVAVIGLFYLLYYLKVSQDAWDGLITAHAIETRNFEGVKIWFYDSGWHLQYWQQLSLFRLSEFFGIPYMALNAIFLFILFMLIVYEIHEFALRVFNLQSKYASTTATAAALLPIWSIGNVSNIFFYFLGLFFALYSMRMIYSNRGVLNLFLGGIGLFIGCNLSSMLLLIPAINYSYFSSDFESRFKKLKIHTFVFAFTIIFFITKRILFPTVGDYQGYNQIQFPVNLEMLNWKIVLFVAFLTWLVPCLLFLAGSSFYVQGKKPNPIEKASLDWIKSSNFKLVLLFIASVLPYIAVGKGHGILFHSERYGLRHTIGLLVVIPIFLGVQHKFVFERFNLEDFFSKFLLKAFLTMTVFFYFALTINSMLGAIELQKYKLELTRELQVKSAVIPDGRVMIIVDSQPGEGFGLLDGQHVLFKATGNLSHFVKISVEEVPLQEWPLPRVDERIHYSSYSLFKPYEGNCITTINVKSDDFTFSEPGSQLRKKVVLLFDWVRGKNSGQVKIQDLRSSC
jgi:hypothetical protein